jgi:alkylhydroperoxidase family enzyme
MANEHGYLPKADLDSLSDELRQRREVWFDKAYRDDNLFLTLANQPEVLKMFLDWTSFIYTDRSSLDPALVELCRIRLAQRNHCVH